MNILILNTSELTGGAAVAANRLLTALRHEGVEARMMVRDRKTDRNEVVKVGGKLSVWHKAWERLVVLWHLRFNKQRMWEIDIANSGIDITQTKAFREADVIHINWVNQGMLSLSEIRRICQSGKRVVWTMHDVWNATGICHYTRGCENFMTACHSCHMLPYGGGKNDLAAKTWKRKQQLYRDSDIRFVTCSRWLMNEAKNSALLKDQKVVSIPNTIDTELFCPRSKAEARQRLGLKAEGQYVLFVSQKVTDERKGASLFVEAMNKIACTSEEKPTVLILGGHAEEVAQQLDVNAHALGYISEPESIAWVYAAADVFVLPSLEDNLPNTIMEAMACGVPCVGFNTGGIPEMIDHLCNGYVAVYRDTEDLASGIRHCLNKESNHTLSAAARQKVMTAYSYKAVVEQYMEQYTAK